MLVAAARAGRYARGRRHQDRQPHHACLLPSMTSAAKTSPDKTPTERRLRLLSCNILAGASVQRYHEYVTRSINAVLPGRSKLDNLDRLAEVLPQFDVIGLQEADAGSLRSGFLNRPATWPRPRACRSGATSRTGRWRAWRTRPMA